VIKTKTTKRFVNTFYYTSCLYVILWCWCIVRSYAAVDIGSTRLNQSEIKRGARNKKKKRDYLDNFVEQDRSAK